YEVVRRVIFASERLEAEQGTTRLAIQFWAEAVRNAELSQLMAKAFSTVFQWFEEVVRTLQNRGELPSHVPPQRIASIFFALVHGFMVQHCLLGVSGTVYCEGLPALMCRAMSQAASNPT